MNEQEPVVYSVYVGIDWADSKHDVCICPSDSDAREFDVILHHPEAIDAWVKGLYQQYGVKNLGSGLSKSHARW